MEHFLKAILENGFVCYGNTFTEIKRKLSKEANKSFNVCDHARVYFEMWKDQVCLTFTRINKKYPNNIIERGQWK